MYVGQTCSIIGDFSFARLRRKYPTKDVHARYSPFTEGKWKTSYFRGWIPDGLLLKGLPLVSIRRVQGYFCAREEGIRSSPTANTSERKRHRHMAHGIALKREAAFRSAPFEKESEAREREEKEISTLSNRRSNFDRRDRKFLQRIPNKFYEQF